MTHGTRPAQPNAARARVHQRGAALLAAMLTVTLVATFAAAALWQQWRAVEVETAERARLQSAWILVGALDWSRLILREDAITGGADHLAEPWAVPLQEARLSTFLAADRNVAQVDDASTDTTDAFLSGQITDMQARLNLTNLMEGDKVNAGALRQFSRLFERLGLPPTTVAVLAPHVTLLPVRTPVNLNTADVDVLWAAIDGLDTASAQKIVQARQARHFRGLSDVTNQLGASIALNADDHAIASRYFEVRGRLRLGATMVDERSLVSRQGTIITTLWRERGAFDRAPLTAAPESGR